MIRPTRTRHVLTYTAATGVRHAIHLPIPVAVACARAIAAETHSDDVRLTSLRCLADVQPDGRIDITWPNGDRTAGQNGTFPCL